MSCRFCVRMRLCVRVPCSKRAALRAMTTNARITQLVGFQLNASANIRSRSSAPLKAQRSLSDTRMKCNYHCVVFSGLSLQQTNMCIYVPRHARQTRRSLTLHLFGCATEHLVNLKHQTNRKALFKHAHAAFLCAPTPNSGLTTRSSTKTTNLSCCRLARALVFGYLPLHMSCVVRKRPEKLCELGILAYLRTDM